jgi:hypothetical protein
MKTSANMNDLAALNAPEVEACRNRSTPAGQALGHLADAWAALQMLEASLPQDVQRWDMESLITARKGTQRAWLALSNLNRSLEAKRHRSSSDQHDDHV